MAHIFISYKSETEKKALEIASRLENTGIDCWIACRDIPVGSDYIDEIPVAIEECPFFILLLSRQMHVSPWVKLELKQAISSGKQVLPLMLEDFKLHPSYTFMLQNYQIYPLFKDDEETFQEVVAKIYKFLPKLQSKPLPAQQPPKPQPKPAVAKNAKPSVPLRTPTPFQGEAPYIYVSFSYKDSDRVMPIVSLVQERGFRIWLDMGIEAGSYWPEMIADKLSKCSCVLAFISESYHKSRACVHELNYSLNLQKPVLTVYLEDVHLSPGLQMQLDALPAIFYQKYPNNKVFLDALTQTALLSPCRE